MTVSIPDLCLPLYFFLHLLQRAQHLMITAVITFIFSGRKAKINLYTALKLTVVMPISCLVQSRHHLVSLNIVTSTYTRYRLNERNLINGKRNFKRDIIKNT